MLTAFGMWPGSYLRAVGRESTIITPSGGGTTAYFLTKSMFTSFGYQPSLVCAAGASAASAGAGLPIHAPTAASNAKLRDRCLAFMPFTPPR